MAKVFIEFDQDDVILFRADLDNNDNEYDVPEEVQEDDSEGLEESVIFTPVFAYKNQAHKTLEFDVEFDPYKLPQPFIQVVFVRYLETFGEDNIMPRWHIPFIGESRRDANHIKELIEEGKFDKEKIPWMEDGCELEEVYVYTLPIED